MATLEDKSLWENDQNDDLEAEILRLNNEEITNRTRLLENDIKVSTGVYPKHSRTHINERSTMALIPYKQRFICESSVCRGELLSCFTFD